MQLLISDSNILIDLIVVDQIENMFNLPFTFAVPDILFDQELKDQHGKLKEMGLIIKSLTSDSIAYSLRLAEQYPKPGRNDLFALALAKQENCPLITGDMDLRNAANDEAVILYGTVWIIEQLVHHNFINIDEARNLFNLMKEQKRRLPWDIVEVHMNKLERELARNN